MRLARYVGRRLLYLIPQLFVISFATFFLVRLLPGNPALAQAGAFPTPEKVKAIEEQLALNEPLPVQYYEYVKRVFHGDLGYSWYTSNSVSADLVQRFPATFELITISLVLALVIMIPLGILTARRTRGLVGKTSERGTFLYGMLAGSLPDFWLALILVYVFYFTLGWFPAPLGRLDLGIPEPSQVTGMYTVDSLIARDWTAFTSAVKHLALPVVTLIFVYGSPILKMTRQTMSEVLGSRYIVHARASGLSESTVVRYAFRNSLPPVITMVAVVYGYLLGGAVLVETVFGWNGIGQYAVQAVTNSDFAPIQGFVLVAACFSILVYLIVDILYFAVDPRVQE